MKVATAGLARDDAKHFCIAHAAEALDKVLFGDRIAAGGQHLGMSSVDDRLAVDQHPVAVKNYQLETAGNHQDRLSTWFRCEDPVMNGALCGIGQDFWH